MDLSVVIPVRNRPDGIRRAIEAVLRGGFDRSRFEFIVIDNGSTDDTARVAAAAGARVISEPVPNRCRARNRGAEAASGRWLAFIDSDCVPEPGWLTSLSRAIADADPHPKRALIAGPVLPAPPSSPVEAYIAKRRWVDQEKFLTPGRRFSPPFAATANLAIRRDVYLHLGGLDPDLATAGEDADFCWRAAEAGYELHYEPNASIVHYHRATLSGLCRQSYEYGIGNAELFARWKTKWDARAWIEPRRYAWAIKALVKTPFAFVLHADPLARREPFYDFLANTAMALGRLRGAIRHRTLII
ncbi:glycosyltransferase [bacterium]|nr:glycosyltransferase [bacterium]